MKIWHCNIIMTAFSSSWLWHHGKLWCINIVLSTQIMQSEDKLKGNAVSSFVPGNTYTKYFPWCFSTWQHGAHGVTSQASADFKTSLGVQWVPQLFEHLEFSYVNKSGKIEHCGNKMHQIIQNMILPRGLELKLSLLWRTTIHGQHPLF